MNPVGRPSASPSTTFQILFLRLNAPAQIKRAVDEFPTRSRSATPAARRPPIGRHAGRPPTKPIGSPSAAHRPPYRPPVTLTKTRAVDASPDTLSTKFAHRPPIGHPSGAASTAFNFDRGTHAHATKITNYQSRRRISRRVLDALGGAPVACLCCVFVCAGVVYMCADVEKCAPRRRERKYYK